MSHGSKKYSFDFGDGEQAIEVTPEEQIKLDQDKAMYGVCFVGTDGKRIDPMTVSDPVPDLVPDPQQEGEESCHGPRKVRSEMGDGIDKMKADRKKALAEQYEICKRRGHQPSDRQTASNPPQSICKWCGTYYRYSEPELRESMTP